MFCAPQEWLFKGTNKGQYSQRAIQNILRDTVTKDYIKKHFTVHTLQDKLCMRINPFNSQLVNILHFNYLTNNLIQTTTNICEEIVRIHNLSVRIYWC